MNFQNFYRKYHSITQPLIYLSFFCDTIKLEETFKWGNFTLRKIIPIILINLFFRDIIDNIKYTDSLSKVIIAQLPDEEKPSVIKVTATPNILNIIMNGLGILSNCIFLKDALVDIKNHNVEDLKLLPLIFCLFDQISNNYKKYTFINANTGLVVDIDKNAEILKAYKNIKLDKNVDIDNNVCQYDYKLIDLYSGEEVYYRVGDLIEYHDGSGTVYITSPEVIDPTAIPSV